jgi:hypothetical protein
MSKYGNKIVTIGGRKFASKKEGYYSLWYKQQEKEGRISDLRMQVPFEIVPAVKRPDGSKQGAVHYIADFVFIRDGKEVVVDVKSEATRKDKVYVLKKKMMLAFLGIEIEEV